MTEDRLAAGRDRHPNGGLTYRATVTPHTLRPLALACGIAGPAAFVGAWAVGGTRLAGYDPVSQAISQLAREGAPTAPLMTSGFVAFGVLLPAYGWALGRALDSPAVRAAATASGLATLAVAAAPLSRATEQPVDTWHAVFAGAGYLAQVAAPLVAARRFRSRPARTASYAVGGAAAAALVASLALPDLTGLLQRTGLTLVDAWFAAVAVHLLRR
jgi:hypothetical protein